MAMESLKWGKQLFLDPPPHPSSGKGKQTLVQNETDSGPAPHTAPEQTRRLVVDSMKPAFSLGHFCSLIHPKEALEALDREAGAWFWTPLCHLLIRSRPPPPWPSGLPTSEARRLQQIVSETPLSRSALWLQDSYHLCISTSTVPESGCWKRYKV